MASRSSLKLLAAALLAALGACSPRRARVPQRRRAFRPASRPSWTPPGTPSGIGWRGTDTGSRGPTPRRPPTIQAGEFTIIGVVDGEFRWLIGLTM